MKLIKVIFVLIIFNSCTIKQERNNKKILIKTAEQLNGSWLSTDNIIHNIKISKKDFIGSWTSKSYHSTAPIVKLAIVEEKLTIAFIDITGGNDRPNPMKIINDTLTIYYSENETRKYVKVK